MGITSMISSIIVSVLGLALTAAGAWYLWWSVINGKPDPTGPKNGVATSWTRLLYRIILSIGKIISWLIALIILLVGINIMAEGMSSVSASLGTVCYGVGGLALIVGMLYFAWWCLNRTKKKLTKTAARTLDNIETERKR
jgi:hypothetical protein